jgi:hypothetical protein
LENVIWYLCDVEDYLADYWVRDLIVQFNFDVGRFSIAYAGRGDEGELEDAITKFPGKS